MDQWLLIGTLSLCKKKQMHEFVNPRYFSPTEGRRPECGHGVFANFVAQASGALISIFFAKKTVSTNINSDISMNVNDSQLSGTEPSFFDTNNEDKLSSQTSIDFLDVSLFSYTFLA